MKNISLIIILSFFILNITSSISRAQTTPVAMSALGVNDPWTDNQLLEPSVLARDLNNKGTQIPMIFNIGAVEDIKNAKHIGVLSINKNLEKLRGVVAILPKGTAIVIYCGCCPFNKCPNIRPAFVELKKLGFTNFKLLNLPFNLQTNWIAKGYPLAN